ncbi:MAG: Metal-dependent phosphohydrolase HD sub domain protein [candidate division TM6 bacterium GW2011_GWF2_37_49]|nr:MAG: Metal-dependent phosphohydrolase HD sub domain protein [candidate division TM6 bacterium GW2011_GWF2_37_49]
MNTYSKEQIINSIETLVRDACMRKTNAFGQGIWTHHIVFVVKYSKMLAQMLGADQEIVEIASLLHDYAGIKDFACSEEHHIHGAQEAETILKAFNYPDDKIEKVKQCVLSHRGSVVIQKNSPEEICVASADAMAHIDQIASLLYAAFNERGKSIEDGKTWVREKLKRSWNKLCPEAQDIVKHKYECALEILK